jgi:hypothetical protein
MHFAYIDAGTGSMALQVILAGALSAAYAFHSRWAVLKKKFMKTDKPTSKTAGQ